MLHSKNRKVLTLARRHPARRPPPRPRGDELASFLTASLRPRRGEVVRTPARARRDDDGLDDDAPVPGLPRPKRRIATFAATVSLLLHAGTVGVAGWIVARAAVADSIPNAAAAVALQVPEVGPPEIELPTMLEVSGDAISHGRTDARASEPRPSGGDRVARPDTARDGKGGTRDVAAPALNLSDGDDRIALAKDMQSSLDRSQVQRVDSGAERTSPEDRRATWQPMEVTFLASGKGARQERRPLAEDDPARGARAPSTPSSLGGAALGSPETAPGEGENAREPGSATRGGEVASPNVGVLQGATGTEHRASADAAFGRPQVTEARPAVPSPVQGKARDNADSEQQVAETVQSLLHASTAGGVAAGSGPGGEKADGKAPGSGGDVGAGSKAKALGTGSGNGFDPDSDESRRATYTRDVTAKIHPLWKNAFPRWAALDGRQGRAIVAFTIQADGHVSSASVARPSGVPEFDENVRSAVLRASPFPPIPARLKSPMTIYLSFDSPNPAVR